LLNEWLALFWPIEICESVNTSRLLVTKPQRQNRESDYTTSMVKRAQSSGLQGAALEAKIAEAHKFEAMYSSPLYRMAMTLLEPLPVGIVMALVTAGILRRKPEDVIPSAASPEAPVS
jgi:hypothetical protein